MENIIINAVIIAIITAILIGAVVYIVKAKKRGKKCIGCPYSCECSSKKCSSNSNKS